MLDEIRKEMIIEHHELSGHKLVVDTQTGEEFWAKEI